MPHTANLIRVSTLEPATGPAAIRCELVTEFSRLQELSPEWESLVAADPQAEIFHRWSWLQASWRACGDTCALCTPVVYAGHKVLGILPLMRRGRALQFVVSPKSDYNDIICAEPHSATVIAAALNTLLAVGGGWTTCVLDNLPAQSRIIRHLQELPAELRRRLQIIFQCPSSGVTLHDNRAEVCAKLIRKEQLRRAQNKLERLGALTFRHIENRPEIRAHLQRFFHQHIGRFAMSGVRSHYLQPECRKFFDALVDELDPHNHLRFSVLELNLRPLAYHFGLQHNGKFIFYQNTFDINYWDYCPGDALLRFLFRYAQASGISEFDFSVGDESYKSRYANHINENFTLYLDRDRCSIRTAMAYCVRHGKGYLRRKPKLLQQLKSRLRDIGMLLSRWQRLARHGGVRVYYDLICNFVRRKVYSRSEIVILSAIKDSLPLDAAPDDYGQCTRAALDELAILSLAFPGFLTPTMLQECRLRFKNGDRAYVARGECGATHVVWVGDRSEIAITGLGSACKIPLDMPVAVIYDWWTSPTFRYGRIDSRVLHRVLQHEAGNQVWTYCSQKDETSLRQLSAGGFRRKCRVQLSSFLNRVWRGDACSALETRSSGFDPMA